ncbi:hypothetical protein Tco_0814762 [Tanacetum coccineum]
MTETLVLGGVTSGNKSSRESLRLGNWIEIARAVTSKEDMTSQEILHRKIKRVKFNSAIIIPSKLTRRNKVFNDVRSDKNTMEVGLYWACGWAGLAWERPNEGPQTPGYDEHARPWVSSNVKPASICLVMNKVADESPTYK